MVWYEGRSKARAQGSVRASPDCTQMCKMRCGEGSSPVPASSRIQPILQGTREQPEGTRNPVSRLHSRHLLCRTKGIRGTSSRPQGTLALQVKHRRAVWGISGWAGCAAGTRGQIPRESVPHKHEEACVEHVGAPGTTIAAFLHLVCERAAGR